jgi:hypothetical protein
MNPAETSLRHPQFSSYISGLLAETSSTSSKAEKLLVLFENNYDDDDDDSDAESQVSSGIPLDLGPQVELKCPVTKAMQASTFDDMICNFGPQESQHISTILEIIGKVHQSILASAKGLRRLFAINPSEQPRPREPDTFPIASDPPQLQINPAERPTVSLQSVEPIRRGDLELRLRAKIFETELTLSTSSPEPTWIFTSGDHGLFPGRRKLVPHPLTPQGRFVADAQKAIEDLQKKMLSLVSM